jgi:hypothetical protein
LNKISVFLEQFFSLKFQNLYEFSQNFVKIHQNSHGFSTHKFFWWMIFSLSVSIIFYIILVSCPKTLNLVSTELRFLVSGVISSVLEKCQNVGWITSIFLPISYFSIRIGLCSKDLSAGLAVGNKEHMPEPRKLRFMVLVAYLLGWIIFFEKCE